MIDNSSLMLRNNRPTGQDRNFNHLVYRESAQEGRFDAILVTADYGKHTGCYLFCHINVTLFQNDLTHVTLPE